MLRRIYFSFLSLALLPALASAQATIQTVVGGGPNQLPAVAASLNYPQAIAVDGSGNVYVSVESDLRVYKIDTTGTLTVFAGNGVSGNTGDGGPATAAEFESPNGIAVDGSGNVYISDGPACVVREVLASTGVIQTVAGTGTGGYTGDGGPATSATLNYPVGLAVDSSGNLYIVDSSNSVVREIAASSGTITTVVGNGTSGYSGDGGPATAAELISPYAIFIDSNKNLFITDIQAEVVRKVTASTGNISTVAGNGSAGYSGDGGPAISATMNAPYSVAADSNGNLYITDGLNAVVRKVVASTGNIQTFAGNGTVGFSGSGGPATSAELYQPIGVGVDSNANVYIVDLRNFVVWEVLAASSNIQVFAGNGFNTYSGDGYLGTSAELNTPQGFNLDGSGNLLVADTFNHAIRKVSSTNGTIQTVAGSGVAGYSGDGGSATNAQLNYPTSVVADAAGDLFIVDQDNFAIREVVASTGNIQTIAGNGTAGYSGDGGPALNAVLSYPQDLKLDSAGDIIFTDSGNSAIRVILASTGNIQTIAGNGTPGYSGDGGPASAAQLSNPNGLFIDASGNIFVADSGNNVVREISASMGNIATIAGNNTSGYSGDGGSATSAQLNFPSGVFVDANGNLFIADDGNAVIREVVASTGFIQTVAGNGTVNFSGDGGSPLSAELDNPFYISPGPSGYFVSDDTMRIRQVMTNNVSSGPAAQLSVASLTFKSNAGVASAAQTVTLSNPGNAALNITSIALSGTNSANFTESNNCGSSVAAGANCTISVTFKAGASGASNASVTITDNAGSPQSVALSGNAGDFSLTMGSGGSNSATIQPGSNATYSLMVSPISGYTGTVSFACTGAPTGATCSVSPTSATFNGGNTGTPVSVTVTTTAPSVPAAAFRFHWPRTPGTPLSAHVLATLLVAFAMLMMAMGRRSRFARICVPATALLLCIGLLAGCGNSSGSKGTQGTGGTPAGTYALTITATPQQGTSHTTSLTLIVQ